MNKSKAFCFLNLHYNINDIVRIKFKTNKKENIIILLYILYTNNSIKEKLIAVQLLLAP